MYPPVRNLNCTGCYPCIRSVFLYVWVDMLLWKQQHRWDHELHRSVFINVAFMTMYLHVLHHHPNTFIIAASVLKALRVDDMRAVATRMHISYTSYIIEAQCIVFMSRNMISWTWQWYNVFCVANDVCGQCGWINPSYLTHLPLDKMAAISQMIFSSAFSWMKMHELWLKCPNWQWISIGLDNGLVPNRRQAIIWAHTDPIHWRIYAAPGGRWVKQLIMALQWRHNEYDGVSNHQPDDCLLNRLFRRSSKKKSKLRVTGLCVGNSPGTGEFPEQRASNAENVSIWWRHHGPHLQQHKSG